MKTAADELSVTFAALADPTRRAILERLRAGEATLGELAEPFDMSLQAVALHLKVLERSGLVTRGRVAQTRPARIAPGPLGSATKWLLGYREFLAGSFERLDGYLEDLQRDDQKDSQRDSQKDSQKDSQRDSQRDREPS